LRELDISREQFGRKVYNVCYLHGLVKYREKRRPCYLAFLDLENVFNPLPRQVLWRALRERNVPEHLISSVRDMYCTMGLRRQYAPTRPD
uniref:Reverse transcriptase domain-containing protein n=1 Tax=Haemonchus placei TaxID=6290 RepID=A0A0N4WMS8_HAEPC